MIKTLYQFLRLKNAEEIMRRAIEHAQDIQELPKGDGNAEFLSDFTEEEFKDYMHSEVHGWGKFYKQLFGK